MNRNITMGSIICTLFLKANAGAEGFYTASSGLDQVLTVCDVLGEGFLHLPQSDACLKIGGSISYDLTMGSDVYSGKKLKRPIQEPGATIDIDVRSQTEMGVLRSFLSVDFESTNQNNHDQADKDSASLSDAFIELGGVLIGATGSQFDLWLDSAGNVLNDDVIAYGGGMTNQIRYNLNVNDSLSALIAFEQGDEDNHIKQYSPHSILGVRLKKNWGSISAIAGYDPLNQAGATKVRIDVKFGEESSIFGMAGLKSNEKNPNYFAPWNGSFAIWSGFSLALLPTVTLNVQAAYEEAGTSAFAVNLEREPFPGLMLTAELDYTKFAYDFSKPDHALGGIISIERSF